MTVVPPQALPTEVRQQSIPGYFNCIDAVRVSAALAVVIFHYHHFYLADYGARAEVPPASLFPYATLLRPFFDHGDKAVELFWIISGFVFTHVYMQTPVSFGRFALARFARLYPLHFVTLLLVLGLQTISLRYADHWQIYGNNDAWYFLFQLLMASNSTTLAQGLSFNGPIWSVSLEIGVYFIFFFGLPLLRRFGFRAALACAALFWWMPSTMGINVPLIESGVFVCAGYFYTGALLFLCFRAFAHRPGVLLGAIPALSLAGAVAVVQGSYVLAHLAVSCAIILGAGLADQRIGADGGRLRTIGNISYSLYLVHVPLQMVVLLVADLFFDSTRSFAESPLLLPVYVMLSLLIAALAFAYIERPAGRYIRGALRHRDQ